MPIFDEYREKVHERIYEASIALFISQGYENATISEITKSVGVAKGTFYNFYPSKLEVLFDWAQRVFSSMDFGKAMLPEQSAEQNLHAFIDLMVEAVDASYGLFRTFLSEHLKQQGATGSATFDFLRIYQAILGNSLDGVKVLSQDPQIKVEMINSVLFMGIINWFSENSETQGLAAHLKKSISMMLGGIRA